MLNFRKQTTPEMKANLKGMMQTVWSDAGSFMDGFYSNKKDDKGGDNTPWQTFKTMYEKIGKL